MESALPEFLQSVHWLHPGWLWAWPISVLTTSLLLRRQRLGSLMRLPTLPPAQTWRHPRLHTLRQLFGIKAQPTIARSLPARGLHYALFLLCLHAALAQPYRLGPQLPPPPEYRDTLFLVDTSLSMVLQDYLAGDIRVDRMTILKNVLLHFTEQLQGTRMGLIVFSEQVYTLLPLTADYPVLRTMIRRLQPAVLTGRTSDLGRVLSYTLQQLQQTEAGPQKPALVLISDVNRSPRDLDPRAIAAYLWQQGYRLHTIGIGTSSETAMESDQHGLIYQPANFELLQTLADKGGGQFYWADSADSLRAAITTIQAGERHAIRSEPRHVTFPLYSWPLAAGLLWLILPQLWPARGRS